MGNKRPDFLELEKNFLRLLKRRKKGLNTLKNYRTDLNCFNDYLLEREGRTAFRAFPIPWVRDYGEYLERRYASDNSRRRRIQTLRRFFDYLAQGGFLSENPIRALSPAPKFLDRPRPTPPEEVKAIWTHLQKESDGPSPLASLTALRNQVIFLLIYGPGLKVSDLSSLEREHLFFGKNPRVLIRPPKRDPYSVPLTPSFPLVFKRYRESLKAVGGPFGREVFFHANRYQILSGGLSSRGIEAIFREFREKITVTATPKSLRQSCICRWLGKGHQEGLIKEWLGTAPGHSLEPFREYLPHYLYAGVFPDI